MLSALEIIIILIIALFIYGPEKLPQLANAAGRAYGEFKKAELSAEFGLYDVEISDKQIKEQNIETKIKDMAIALGLEVRGKSTSELLSLIGEIAKNKNIK